eukprot:463831-Pyramimonas_sp.AAC.1
MAAECSPKAYFTAPPVAPSQVVRTPLISMLTVGHLMLLDLFLWVPPVPVTARVRTTPQRHMLKWRVVKSLVTTDGNLHRMSLLDGIDEASEASALSSALSASRALHLLQQHGRVDSWEEGMDLD